MLAWLDKFVSRLLYIDYCYIEPGRNGSAVELRFYHTFGPRMAIIHPDRMAELGRYFEIVHLYDRHNRLVTRKFRREILEAGDSLVVDRVFRNPFNESLPLFIYKDYAKGELVIIDKNENNPRHL
ncbi:MAG: hypothetical protein A2750_03445 [Candidatus Yanofskybacteria bacterium RIFCSPHIGHO2_01_FULL_45_42]|nr:MAG: hypothetical protein A2750_03445 [Candidatus Yanofskybacteria bacterium RIFCSPHIGHO2_01_FULL_45_42]